MAALDAWALDPESEAEAWSAFLNRLRPAWQRDAACRENPLVDFFPRRGASTDAARAVCERCLVRSECLDYAITENISEGIWGATSGRQRRQMRKIHSDGG